MIKVIFLDFDGVMLSTDLIRNLNTIVTHTSADIVLSTDWRRHWNQNDLTSTLYDLGFTGNIIGVTPELNKTQEMPIYGQGKTALEKERVIEINVWLDKNPQVDNWVAIDDMDLTKGDISDSNFVRTTFTFGLTDDLANKAINMLN